MERQPNRKNNKPSQSKPAPKKVSNPPIASLHQTQPKIVNRVVEQPAVDQHDGRIDLLTFEVPDLNLEKKTSSDSKEQEEEIQNTGEIEEANENELTMPLFGNEEIKYDSDGNALEFSQVIQSGRDSKSQGKLDDMLSKFERKKKPTRKQIKRTVKTGKNLNEGTLNSTSPPEGSSEILPPVAKNSALMTHYNHFVRVPTDDSLTSEFIKTCHSMFQVWLLSCDETQTSKLNTQFTLIVDQQFDKWRTAAHRPAVWNALAPKLTIDVILRKIMSIPNLPETDLGDYAKIVCRQLGRLGFDIKSIDNRFNLSSNP